MQLPLVHGSWQHSLLLGQRTSRSGEITSQPSVLSGNFSPPQWMLPAKDGRSILTSEVDKENREGSYDVSNFDPKYKSDGLSLHSRWNFLELYFPKTLENLVKYLLLLAVSGVELNTIEELVIGDRDKQRRKKTVTLLDIVKCDFYRYRRLFVTIIDYRSRGWCF